MGANLCFVNVVVNALQNCPSVQKELEKNTDCRICNILKESLKGDKNSPMKLKNILSLSYAQYNTNQQQCPAEFIRHLTEQCKMIRDLSIYL